MKKKNLLIVQSLWIILFILFFIACKNSPSSPEIKKRAKINVTVDPDPILLHWDSDLNQGNFQCKFIMTEKNGVGVNISKFAIGFVYEKKVWGEWVLFQGRLEPFGTKTVTAGGGVIRSLDEIRVTVNGKDDNGNELNIKITFSVEWD